MLIKQVAANRQNGFRSPGPHTRAEKIALE
jgi:hypothetical protein